MNSKYWQVIDNHFTFPVYLSEIRSEEGRRMKDLLTGLNNGLQIFLRGSLLEDEHPFQWADIDMFILYDNQFQLKILNNILPINQFYDIKLIMNGSSHVDYVFNALLQCRSLEITGKEFTRVPILADKQFAWEHWIKYCPTMIPDRIDTQSTMALIYFKLLTRCFGVISFLKNRSFTRDISECISIAQSEEKTASDFLTEMRECLESKKPKTFYVAEIKKLLTRKFDEYYNFW